MDVRHKLWVFCQEMRLLSCVQGGSSINIYKMETLQTLWLEEEEETWTFDMRVFNSGSEDEEKGRNSRGTNKPSSYANKFYLN